MDRDGVVDLTRQREDGTHGKLRDLAEAPHEDAVGGVGHRGGEHAVEHIEAERLGFLRDLGGNAPDGFLGDDGRERVDVGDVDGIGPVAACLILWQDFFVDDGLDEIGAIETLRERRHLLQVIEVRQFAETFEEGFMIWIWHGGRSWL